MTEEQRTHHTVTVMSKRLGLFLVPHDDANRGAMLERFELLDGKAGEVEQSGKVSSGFVLTAINDSSCEWLQFPKVVAMLQECGRPVRLTWRDPNVHEFRDRHQFLRTKLHVAKEAEYLDKAAPTMRANDMAWLDFLKELGGSRGVSWGQRRLVRDATGRLEFPINPDVRLNAVSPTHARVARPQAFDSAGAFALTSPSSEPSTLTAEQASAAMVVSIYRRCWEPGGIGVSVPPGLGLKLPGELPKASQADKYRDQLTKLVLRGGIPAAFRPSLWWELSGAHAKCRLHPPGYYASMASARPSAEASQAILKDIDRTFPGHPRAETEEFRTSLLRVLSAFSVHAAEIGYCQSLNFLAGFLLLLLDEEKAFWTLEVMVNELLPPEYYHEGLLGVNADTRVLAHLVSELLPDVGEAFERAGVAMQIVTVEWFMAAFATTLPTLTALRVWDAFFLLGGEVLFRAGLVLFLQQRNRIISVAASSTTSNVVVRRDEGGEAAGGSGSSKARGSSEDVTSPRVLVATAGEESRPKGTLATLGLGPRDTVAETAAKVLAAVSASGIADGLGSGNSPGAGMGNDEDGRRGGFAGGVGSAPSSPAPSALARGGTVRSPASTFPALFGMLKQLPSGCHDPDELMRLAFPPSNRDAKDSLDWSKMAPARLAKLRQAARARAEEELGMRRR